MAVSSKFAVSVAVVAVGYGGERCGTASALQVIKALLGGAAVGGSTVSGQTGAPGETSPTIIEIGEEIRRAMNKAAENSEKFLEVGEQRRLNEKQKVVQVENGNITLDMITKVKEQLSNTEKVDEVLHKIGCSDPEKKTMQNLLHYLTDAPIEEKEMFCKTFTDLQAQGSTRPWVHAAIKFMHTFGELVKGEGSKCGLKGAIQGLLDETPDLQTPDREEEAIVIELLKKNPGLKKKAEQAVKEIKSSSKGGLLEKILLGIGIVSIAAVVILLVVCVFCVCGSSAGSTAMSCM